MAISFGSSYVSNVATTTSNLVSSKDDKRNLHKNVIGYVSEYIDWKIPDIFSRQSQDKIQVFYSPIFSLSGFRCQIEMAYPSKDGCRSGGDYIPLKLVITSRDHSGTIENSDEFRPSFSFLRSDGSLSDTLHYNHLWANRSTLTPNDQVTIRCNLCEISPSKKFKRELFRDLTTFSADYEDLLTDQKNCDVIIKVGDAEFQAHKIVLMTRCPVLAGGFQHGMIEGQTGVLTITDIDPDVFGDFLRYLYTGRLKGISSVERVIHLYITSDKYDVQELKIFCQEFLKENVSAENFCDILSIGDLHKDKEILRWTQIFLNDNFKGIFQTTAWELLMTNNSKLAVKLLKGMSSG